MNKANNSLSLRCVIVLVLLWAGLLLGVSFLATPVKFLAPSLSMTAALDVGRQTFTVFNRVEALLSLTLLALLWHRVRLGEAWRWYLPAVALVVLVFLQLSWLLPVLDARVETILQGGQPSASSLHSVYVVIEVIKLVLLLGLGCMALARFSSPRAE